MLPESISLICRIEATTSAMPPRAGTDPPESPVPAPRGTTGISRAEANRRVAATASGEGAITTTSGNALALVPS